MIFFRRVEGKSMLPTLRPGQTVIAHRVRNFKVGQVIIAYVNGREVIKRITKLEYGRVFIEGDNPEASTDSRDYGSVADRLIEGVVFWPRV
jgi:nickel-type superoxide dismutase maturation protease